jgi:hypothetical protein
MKLSWDDDSPQRPKAFFYVLMVEAVIGVLSLDLISSD